MSRASPLFPATIWDAAHQGSPRAAAGPTTAALPDVRPPEGMLTLSTMRSHDQWNTTVYADDDRYRGVKNLRTLLLMNRADMDAHGLAEYDLIDITSHARDGSTRAVYGYHALAYDIPAGSVAGYMPELNLLCGLDDYSRQSDHPLTKHLLVSVAPSRPSETAAAAG